MVRPHRTAPHRAPMKKSSIPNVLDTVEYTRYRACMTKKSKSEQVRRMAVAGDALRQVAGKLEKLNQEKITEERFLQAIELIKELKEATRAWMEASNDEAVLREAIAKCPEEFISNTAAMARRAAQMMSPERMATKTPVTNKLSSLVPTKAPTKAKKK